MYESQPIQDLASSLDKKTAEKLRLPVLLRLIQKLNDKEIKDEQVFSQISDLTQVLEAVVQGDRSRLKAYRDSLNELTEMVRTKHGLVAKGYYTSLYLSIGIALGAGIGTALMAAVNVSFMAIGIGVGISLGVAFGAGREDKLDKDGLLY